MASKPKTKPDPCEASPTHMYRAFCHAILGHKHLADDDLKKYVGIEKDESTIVYATAIIQGSGGDYKGAIQTLDQFLPVATQRGRDVYNVACAYSILLRQAMTGEAGNDHQSTLRTNALAALKLAVENGYTQFDHIQRDVDLEAIRQTPQFRKIIKPGGLDRQYAAAWNTFPGLESRELHDLSPGAHRKAMRQLEGEGFIPVAITLLATQDGDEPFAVSYIPHFWKSISSGFRLMLPSEHRELYTLPTVRNRAIKKINRFFGTCEDCH